MPLHGKWLIVALLGVTLSAGAAFAASPRLRPVVEVDRNRVTLGDLFDGAGALAGVPVLDAPPPGERLDLSIAQAFELASQHGLGWRPMAPFDHVSILRAWRYLDQHEILGALKLALRQATAGDKLALDLSEDALRIKVARGALAELTIENLTFDAESRRFQAILVVRAASSHDQRYNLFGHAYAVTEVPVFHTRLRTEDIIRSSDIEWIEVRAERLPDDAVTDARALIGKSPTRAIAPGKPVRARDVGEPTIVRRGAMVAMHFRSPNLHLVASGRAQESGARGDVIPVQNISSRMIVEGIVTGPNRVEVHSPHQLAAVELAREGS